MKYILILIYSFLLPTFAFSADNLLMFKNLEGNTYQLLKIDQSSGSETVVTSITLDQAIATDNSYFDAYENKFYIHQGAGLTSELKVYDFNSDSWSDVKRSSGGLIYNLAPYQNVPINKMVRVDSNGALHIGENSLVTQEIGGVQQLYATDSSGNQIDINIKSGTNLLINGANVNASIGYNSLNISSNDMDIATNVAGILANTNLINSESQKLSNRIEASTALSSALASLPSSSPDAAYTCGIGTGLHNSNSALAAGCAADFANFAFVDNLPKIFERASFNIGSSFLMNGEPDLSEARDTSIKAGITFKFGAPKKIRTADITQLRTEKKIDAVMLQNKKVMDENAILKKQLANNNEKNQLLEDQIAAINLKLETLNMIASN